MSVSRSAIKVAVLALGTGDGEFDEADLFSLYICVNAAAEVAEAPVRKWCKTHSQCYEACSLEDADGMHPPAGHHEFVYAAVVEVT